MCFKAIVTWKQEFQLKHNHAFYAFDFEIDGLSTPANNLHSIILTQM